MALRESLTSVRLWLQGAQERHQIAFLLSLQIQFEARVVELDSVGQGCG
jgi:hypothetical protein